MLDYLKDVTRIYFKGGGPRGPSHTYTGAFEGSLETRVIKDGMELTIQVWGRDYGTYLNRGVQPTDVPFTATKRGQPRGGTSLYIQGLVGWVEGKLGVPPNESLGVAFAIAHRAIKVGYPERPFRSGELGSGWLDELKERELENIKREAFAYLKKEVDELKIIP